MLLLPFEQLIHRLTVQEILSTKPIPLTDHAVVIQAMHTAIYSAYKNQLSKWNIAVLVNLFAAPKVNENHVFVKEAKAIFLLHIKDRLNMKVYGDVATYLLVNILNAVIREVSINDHCELELKDILLELGGNEQGTFDLTALANNYKNMHTNFALFLSSQKSNPSKS